jgi:hypothetical protein
LDIYNEEDSFHAAVTRDDGKTFKIRCRVDGRVRLTPEGGLPKEALLEIKSYSIFFKRKFEIAFEKEAEIRGGLAYPREGKWSHDMIWPEYQAQAQISMLASGMGECYFMPLFRDDGQVGYKHSDGYFGAVVVRDEEEITKILDRFFHIQGVVENGGDPEPDYNPSSRECSYCDFWEYCWGAQGFKRYRKGN